MRLHYRGDQDDLSQKCEFAPALPELKSPHSSAIHLCSLLRWAARVKKKASETTDFELLVLAFRVFESPRSKVENSED